MTLELFGVDGKPIRLGQRIGKGGEGDVYELEESSDLVLKHYTVKDLRSREEKVRVMVAENLATKSALIAFPVALVFDKAGRFSGFKMSKVAAHRPLHDLYSPGARKIAFPNANYRFLVACAANVARAIGSAHASGCVVGDINHSGVLISQKATVSLIDADSFQISDGAKHYLCKVGVPEYTPSELQGIELGSIVRTPNHDAFGLAVVIFQLLFMGRHPFSGKYASGEMPLEKAISEYRFAYTNRRSVGMTPPPGVPTLRDFPTSIGAAFEAAFSPEKRMERPTARQWITVLGELGKTLQVCSRTSLHHYSSAAPECPWCRMEKRFAVPLFIPALPAIDVNTVYTPAIGDIQAIWQAIEAVRPPSNLPFPQHTGSTPSVTESTIAIKKRHKLKSIAGWMLVAAGVVVFSYSASLFLVAAILIGIGAVNIAQKIPGGEEATRRYTDIQTRIFQAESEWRQQSSGAEFLSLKSDLKNKKDAYDALPAEEKRRVEDHNRNRRAIQLSTYLDTFQIRQFKIPKVGPTKQAMLVSYGIETAGDVNEAAVLRVPGFGPRTSQPLLNWRRHLESRFKYTPSPNASDVVAINAIRTDIAAKALRLKTELTNGAAILSQLPAAI